MDAVFIEPLCPLDQRYQGRVLELQEYLTEFALIRARVEVEIEYLIALSDFLSDPQFPVISQDIRDELRRVVIGFTPVDAARIRLIETEINHDVKAIEYWLREKTEPFRQYIPVQFIHFALTSEDVTNLAYGLLINKLIKSVVRPQICKVKDLLMEFSQFDMDALMLGMTHGQPATPTSVWEQMMVFQGRLDRQYDQLREFNMQGKFGGAVANYSAHRAAYPVLKWTRWGEQFVKNLGLTPIAFSKQINPHDDTAELSHLMTRINTILMDMARDMWLYISRDVFCEKVKASEVGSSTMPHKVNPIDWENAEGNLGVSNALFGHFADKLPISRMQRDLSDSTVQRYLGVAFGAQLLAAKSIQKGLGKLQINKHRLQEELANHPEVHTEAIQTVMRRFGYLDAYEQMKVLSRGSTPSTGMLAHFVRSLENVPPEGKNHLLERLGFDS